MAYVHEKDGQSTGSPSVFGPINDTAPRPVPGVAALRRCAGLNTHDADGKNGCVILYVGRPDPTADNRKWLWELLARPILLLTNLRFFLVVVCVCIWTYYFKNVQVFPRKRRKEKLWIASCNSYTQTAKYLLMLLFDICALLLTFCMLWDGWFFFSWMWVDLLYDNSTCR
jgi:hypothetical protein